MFMPLFYLNSHKESFTQLPEKYFNKLPVFPASNISIGDLGKASYLFLI